jgi:hypothetical protein
MTELQTGRWVARMKSGKQIEQGSCALQKNSSVAQRSCAVALGRQKKNSAKKTIQALRSRPRDPARHRKTSGREP